MDASCSQLSYTGRAWVMRRSGERVGGWEWLEGSLGRVMNGKGWEETLLEGSGQSWGVRTGGVLDTGSRGNAEARRSLSRLGHD